MFNKPTDLFSNPDWSGLQAQYLEALNAFNSSFTGKSQQQSLQDQWIKAMDFWWQSNKTAIPAEQRGFFDHIMNQGKSMYYLADQFSQVMDAVSTMEKTSDDWLKTVDEQINVMKEGFMSGANPGLNMFQDVISAFSTPNDAFTPFANLQDGVNPFLSSSANGFDFAEQNIEQLFEKYLSIPGVGYSRETQEKIQKNIVLYKAYQKVNDEYNQSMSKVGINALEKLRNRIIEHAKKDNKIDSLREIYDLWVDCNEEAYAEYVFSDDYSKLNGRLINSLMQFKKHNSELMEEIFAGFNLPSKRQIDELLVSQQSLKHKLKQSEREKANMLSRLDSLEAELKAISKQPGSRQSVVTKPKKKVKAKADKATEKTVAKKKPARKKAKKKASSKSDKNVIEIKF